MKYLHTRGDTQSNDGYVGRKGEITIDTEAKALRLHDGLSPGGHTLGSFQEAPMDGGSYSRRNGEWVAQVKGDELALFTKDHESNDDTQALQDRLDAMAARYAEALANGQNASNVLYLSGERFNLSRPIRVPGNIHVLGTSLVPYNTGNMPWSAPDGANWQSGTTLVALPEFVGKDLVDLEADNARISGVVVDGDSLPFNYWWADFTVTTAQGKTESREFLIGFSKAGGTMEIKDVSIPPFQGHGEAFQLQATGGDVDGNGYTWDITAGTLPDGLTLSSGGLISGTPTRPGLHEVTFRATAQTTQVTKTLPVVVPAGNIDIAVSRVWDHTVGEVIEPYSLVARNASDPSNLVWILFDGPEGMVLDQDTGEISGTITAEYGEYTAEVHLLDLYEVTYYTDSINTDTVSDVTDCVVSTTEPGLVADGLFWVNPETQYTQVYVNGGWRQVAWAHTDRRFFDVSIKATDEGVRIQNAGDISPSTGYWIQNEAMEDYVFKASGGSGGWTYTIDSVQEFPEGYEPGHEGYPSGNEVGPGVSLSEAGVLTGTPTATGSYNFFVRATSNDNPDSYWAELVIMHVEVPGARPKLLAGELPSQILGYDYLGKIRAEEIPEAQPYTYKVTGLPTGLTMDPNTGIITGTPVDVEPVGGINLNWGGTTRDIQVRGFRSHRGIRGFGPTNLHRISHFMVTECLEGVALSQCYDSHFDEGYIYKCGTNLNLESGAAANTFVNIRLEYSYQHNLRMLNANENQLLGVYFDTAGWAGLHASKSNNLLLNGCRFYRSGRLVWPTVYPYGGGGNTDYSAHMVLSECVDATVVGCVTHSGSHIEGGTGEYIEKDAKEMVDFVHPETSLRFYDCPGLMVQASNMAGCVGLPITYVGGSLSGVNIDNITTERPWSTREPKTKEDITVVDYNFSPDGAMADWPFFDQNQTTTRLMDNTLSLARGWSLHADQYTNQSVTVAAVTPGPGQRIPTDVALHIQKPVEIESDPEVYSYQNVSVRHDIPGRYARKAMELLAGKWIILTFWGRADTTLTFVPSVIYYPGTADNNYNVLREYGSQCRLSSAWKKYTQFIKVPDWRYLNITDQANIEINFPMDHGEWEYDFQIGALKVEPASPRFIPSAWDPMDVEQRGDTSFALKPEYVTTSGEGWAMFTTDGQAGTSDNRNIFPEHWAGAFTAIVVGEIIEGGTGKAFYRLETAMRRSGDVSTTVMVGDAATQFTLIGADPDFGETPPVILMSEENGIGGNYTRMENGTPQGVTVQWTMTYHML